jgi:alpha-ketoglutarate-dependent taurine dioxygenase
VSTLPPLLQQALRLQNQSDLPNQTYFADGSEIDAATLDELREAYHAETRTFLWQPGDVLMLDNMMVAHGRRPFSGQRRVVVGMADPCSWDSV